MLRLVNELTGVTIAFAIGLYAYRYMNLFYRIFFFQLFAFILIYCLARLIETIEISDNIHPDTQWVYNLSMPFETGLLTWAAYEYFKTNKRKFLILIGYAIFLAVFISELFIKGIRTFSNHGYIAESILLLILYLSLLYTQFTKGSPWKHTPKLWISLGIVLFFGGVVPYLSLMQYLQNTHPKLNSFLYYFIIDGLENVRYLLLAVGFWIVYRNTVIKKPLTNE